MKLSQDGQNFAITLSLWERLVACHVGDKITLPFRDIESVSTLKPQFSWRVIRAPGTSIPGLISAGTFYTGVGREFWWIDRGQQYLVVKLRSGYYKRVVLNTDDHTYWEQVLQEEIAKL